jgi:hypothetical protein
MQPESRRSGTNTCWSTANGSRSWSESVADSPTADLLKLEP